MSSSGLKLRDTRELLARPDHSQAEESVHPHFPGPLQGQDVSISAKEFSTTETVNSMPPSLAMANANTPASNHNESLSTEAIAAQNSSREIEPISKKRRILEATESAHEVKETEKQPSSSEDILARACIAVGIGGDISESVVEEPLPNNQEYNGEIHRLPANHPYTRGVRLPSQGIPLSPRLRHPDDIRIRHPIHPAFRPPNEGTYGMEIRSLYNHGHPVPPRIPMHPNEAYRYYAVPRYPNRYPYVGPPGSMPPSLTRPPVMRPTPPNVPHERRPSIPHGNQGYPYDPHHLPRQAIHHSPQPVSPLHREHRLESSEANHAHLATSESRPVHPSHTETAYRVPPQHGMPVGKVPQEQLSPTSVKHPYPRPGIPTSIRPTLHGNPQNPLQDPRSTHIRVNEAYPGGIIHGIHPPRSSPHPNSPNELTCENPFQIPDPQHNSNIALMSKYPATVPSQPSPPVKVLTSPLESSKPKLTSGSHRDDVTHQTRVEIMSDDSTTISRSTAQNFLQRRPREPPEPCVELIPIPAASQEVYNRNKLNEKIPQLNSRQPTAENQTSIGSPKTYHSDVSEIVHDESQQNTTKIVEKIPEIASDNPPNKGSIIEEVVLEKEESTNKDPKKSFRKRWLDKEEYPSPKRSVTQEVNLTEQLKTLGTQALREKTESKEATVIVLDDDESSTTENFKLSNLTSVSTKSQVGPGQLHCLHSSVYINNMRSASEPPLETSQIPKNVSVISNRPASVPCSVQQLQSMRAKNESQNKVNSENIDKTIKGNDNDDEFVNRLKLVLNDLISVPLPEVTKLQHHTCPIDELLASLVKRKGALPSENPNPKERLRQDFLVLVKLCMSSEVLEEWGWNNSSPEEILDELIKVTNNGLDNSKGNARLSSTRENIPPPHTSPDPADTTSNTAPTNHVISSPPCPVVSVSPVFPNTSPVSVIPVSSPKSQHPASSFNSPVPPQHTPPILIQYPSLSPQHHPVTHAPKHPSVSLHPVPSASQPSHYPPPISPQHSTASSMPLYHPPASNSQPPSNWPSPRNSIPPLSRPTNHLSTNSEPSYPHSEDPLEDEVFSPTNKNPPPLTKGPYNPHTVPYPRAQIPIHPPKAVHEGAPSNVKSPQEHVGYSPSGTVQMHSQNTTHPHNVPITVLHYPQVPQPSQNSPYIHSSHPYGNPGGTHNIHNPPHYPRGPYSQPYPYAYYHPNSPHYPRPPYRHASIIHSPNNPHPPRPPYNPRSPHRSPTTHGAIRLVAQPPAPLSPSHWSEERIVTSAAIKPPA